MNSNDSEDKRNPNDNSRSVVPAEAKPLARIERTIDAVNRILADAEMSLGKAATSILIPFRKGNKFGYVDRSGSWIIRPAYDEASCMVNGIGVVGVRNEKEAKIFYGLIDDSGNQITECVYDEYETFRHSRALVGFQLNDKWGFIDTACKQVVEPRFQSVSSSGEGLICVQNEEGAWGYVDCYGKEVISCSFEDAARFCCGRAVVREILDHDAHIIDRTGASVFTIKSLDNYWESYCYGPFSENLLLVECRSTSYPYVPSGILQQALRSSPNRRDAIGTAAPGWYFINTLGKVEIAISANPQKLSAAAPDCVYLQGDYTRVSSFSEGLCAVEKGDRSGYIDRAGIEIIPCEFEYAGAFREELASIMKGDLYGLIDKAGDVVLPPTYSSISHFSEGLAAVGTKEGFGFIDKSGNQVIPCRYHTPPDYLFFQAFEDGLCCVARDEVTFYIDTAGHEYYEP